jgi:hypothetical protein
LAGSSRDEVGAPALHPFAIFLTFKQGIPLGLARPPGRTASTHTGGVCPLPGFGEMNLRPANTKRLNENYDSAVTRRQQLQISLDGEIRPAVGFATHWPARFISVPVARRAPGSLLTQRARVTSMHVSCGAGLGIRRPSR